MRCASKGILHTIADTIDYSKLLSKLHNYGIRGNALELIKSYLSDRKQYVNVLYEESRVPQGSVLGPLLFYYILMILIAFRPSARASKGILHTTFARATHSAELR